MTDLGRKKDRHKRKRYNKKVSCRLCMTLVFCNKLKIKMAHSTAG